MAVTTSALVGACATAPNVVEQPAGYWSQIEDFGANPPPRSDLDADPQGTFHPYVQAPGASWGVGYAGSVGWSDGYYGAMRPGFDANYYTDPFYATNPYLLGVYAPIPRSTPPPATRPNPPAKPPPAHPVTPPHPRPPPAAGVATRPLPPPPPPRMRDSGDRPNHN